MFLKDILSGPYSEYAARPVRIPPKDIYIDGRRVTYFDLSPVSPKPDLDRDIDTDPRYRFHGLKYITFSDPRFSLPGCAISTIVIKNKIGNKPIVRGSIALLTLTSLAAYFTGAIWNKWRRKHELQNELIVWDYVSKHPEDFPELFEKRKTYSEVLMPWRPAR